MSQVDESILKVSVDAFKPLDVFLAGVMYDDRHLVVPQLALREQVRLCHESDNVQDANAVLVERQNGQPIGYVRRELAAYLAPQMDKAGECIDATITELSSDASGSHYRVRVRFSVPTEWLDPKVDTEESRSQVLEYYYDDTGVNTYVLLNCTEEQFNSIREGMTSVGIQQTRYGLCYRPAGNGRQYQWYARIEGHSNTNRSLVEDFFRSNFNLAPEQEAIDVLETAKKRFESELFDLQGELTKYQQEAKEYEYLAEEIDAESKQAKQVLQQKIENLRSEVEAREQEILQIDDEKRRLRYENESLRSSLIYSNVADEAYDVPDNVADVLLDTVGETLLPSQSLLVVSRLSPTRLEVLDSAWKSADDSKSFRHKKQLFELLWKLATEYWYALANGRSDTEARYVFGEHYAAKESETVERNKRSCAQRTFAYKGNEVQMMRHLKIGVKESVAETMHIHFEWIADDRKIVIGHCGPHLD